MSFNSNYLFSICMLIFRLCVLIFSLVKILQKKLCKLGHIERSTKVSCYIVDILYLFSTNLCYALYV